MADRIAVMMDGKLQAYAKPHEIYDQPRTRFVAGFVGNPPMNFLEVEVARENGEYHARAEGIDIIVPTKRGEKVAMKGKVTMGIRPENVSVEDGGIQGDVFTVEPLGRDDLVEARIGDVALRALADPALRTRMGERASLKFDTEKVQFFDPETEQSLLWN